MCECSPSSRAHRERTLIYDVTSLCVATKYDVKENGSEKSKETPEIEENEEN